MRNNAALRRAGIQLKAFAALVLSLVALMLAFAAVATLAAGVWILSVAAGLLALLAVLAARWLFRKTRTSVRENHYE